MGRPAHQFSQIRNNLAVMSMQCSQLADHALKITVAVFLLLGIAISSRFFTTTTSEVVALPAKQNDEFCCSGSNAEDREWQMMFGG